MSEYSNKLLIPIRWRAIVGYGIPFFLVCFLGIIITTIKPVVTTGVYLFLCIVNAVMAALLLLSVCMCCISHIFTKDYLVIRFLWIPIHKIRWSSIRSARYGTKWRDDGRIRFRWQSEISEGHAIFVSQNGILRYNPTGDIRWLYHLKHPLKATCIMLPASDAEFYIEEFKSHFPSLEVVGE